MTFPVPTDVWPVDTHDVEFVQETNGIMVRAIRLAEVGLIVPQHKHEVDHVTFVMSGKARFWKNGEWQEDIRAFGVVEVKAGDEHLFQALEPDTRLACVFNTMTEQFKKFMMEK